MNDDITTRLRRDCMSLIADEAADTIEQLRADVMCLKYQNAEFVRNLTMAQDERNAATAERDEARREVCECKCSPPKTPFFGAPQELAEVNGWDCFKENTK